MKLYVKYMVSLRCKMVVRATIESMGLHCTKVELGEADIVETLTHEQHDDLKKNYISPVLNCSMKTKRYSWSALKML
jgi:hypothetical protein